MGILSGLWTFALLPLSLVGIVACALAVEHRNWLTAAALASALAFSLARLVATVAVSRAARSHTEAAAAVWRGEELRLGAGARRPAYFLGWALVLCLVGAAFFPGAARGLFLALAVGTLAGVVVLSVQASKVLLQVGRRGVWDRKHGWTDWKQVQQVLLSSYGHAPDRNLHGQLRHSSLVLRLRPDDGVGAEVVSYSLNWLRAEPERVLAAAQGWHQLALAGTRIDPTPAQAAAANEAGRLDRARARMGRATVLLLASYVLAPFAYFADGFMGWPR